MGAFVVVVGLGGVGSHAAHMLLRSGVGRLRLIDFDQVTLSSLNRHATATRQDVGLPKAMCLQAALRRIMPEAQIDACVAMYTAEDEEEMLSGEPDYVLDAIDNIDTKVALLAACRRRGLPVLCVAGAGAKVDPTRVRIADLGESSADRLARAVRMRLRRDHGIEGGIPVVLSTERPRCELVPAGEPGANPLDYQIVPGFRVRTIPVLGTTPAVFGMAAAAHILCALAGAPLAPEPLIRLQAEQYAVQLARLAAREELLHGTADGLAVDIDDVTYLVRELWRGISARCPGGTSLPGGDKGLHRSTADLVLTRWDKARPATVDNLLLLTFGEAEAHEHCSLHDADCGSAEEGTSADDVDAESAQLLEWPAVCAQVAAFACTPAAAERALSDRLPLGTSLEDSEHLLCETSEAATARLEFSGVRDLRLLLDADGTGGAALHPFHLHAIAATLDAAAALRERVESRAQAASHAGRGGALRVLAAGIGDALPELRRDVWRCIHPEEARLVDSASAKLADVRAARGRNRAELRTTLDAWARAMLGRGASERAQVVVRRDRLAISIRAGRQGELPEGSVVLGASASGATVYAEPAPAVALNNAEARLSGAEAAEEAAILRRLTCAVVKCTPRLRQVLDAVTALDIATARAKHAAWLGAVRPRLLRPGEAEARGCVRVRGMRHPLLLQRALPPLPEPPAAAEVDFASSHLNMLGPPPAAPARHKSDAPEAAPAELPRPVDLLVRPGARVVMITGPNTGGKTAALKALGLAALMAKAGLYLPVTASEEPAIAHFDHVLADVGDGQSLQQSLSTFSGHVRRASRVLATATPGSLVLLDEVGSGTDPVEGSALAAALLHALADRAALTLCTTHQAPLKDIAARDARFENASVEFDLATLRPTYRLMWGAAGASNALAVAEGLGFDASILADARRATAEAAAAPDARARASALQASLSSEVGAARAAAKLAAAEREAASAELDALKATAAELREREAHLEQAAQRARQAGAAATREAEAILALAANGSRAVADAEAALAALRAAAPDTRAAAATLMGLLAGGGDGAAHDAQGTNEPVAEGDLVRVLTMGGATGTVIMPPGRRGAKLTVKPLLLSHVAHVCLTLRSSWAKVLNSLQKSIAAAVEARPRGLPKPAGLFSDPDRPNLHVPLGLRYRHLRISAALYNADSPGNEAEQGLRSLFIEAMSSETQGGILVTSMEQGLRQGTLEPLAWDASGKLVTALINAYSTDVFGETLDDVVLSKVAPRLGAGTEQRMLALLNERVLPLAYKCLRLLEESCEPPLQVVVGDEERMRAVRSVCAALPMTAQRFAEQMAVEAVIGGLRVLHLGPKDDDKLAAAALIASLRKGICNLPSEGAADDIWRGAVLDLAQRILVACQGLAPCVRRMLRDMASEGKPLPDVAGLLILAASMGRLCRASKALTAELFREGVLGSWVRLAQRLVAAQPHQRREEVAGKLLNSGLMPLLKAVGTVVPQVDDAAKDVSNQAGCAIPSNIAGSFAAASGHATALIIERSVADIARVEALPSDSLVQLAMRECSLEDMRLVLPKLIVGCWSISCRNMSLLVKSGELPVDRWAQPPSPAML
ncbi:hypothetical protein WJX81_008230 [Elliptochloris bilobata]|uniref:DNA mismatch repair proteins mutS family domain-containing protein n=1 Tax=Elliptochloris bilobata TaxID=381761 RepID=A0AAW1SD53_9CHLO